MEQKHKTYEDKKERPRRLYGVRLSDEEKAQALLKAGAGETLQNLIRRLLDLPPASA